MRRIGIGCLLVLLAVCLCACKNYIKTSLPSDTTVLLPSTSINTAIQVAPDSTSPQINGIPNNSLSESIMETETHVLSWQEAYVGLLRDYSGQFRTGALHAEKLYRWADDTWSAGVFEQETAFLCYIKHNNMYYENGTVSHINYNKP